MCSLAWAATTKEKGGPRGERAAAGHAVKEGGEMLGERFLLVAELGLCLNKDLALGQWGGGALLQAQECLGEHLELYPSLLLTTGVLALLVSLFPHHGNYEQR